LLTCPEADLTYYS